MTDEHSETTKRPINWKAIAEGSVAVSAVFGLFLLTWGSCMTRESIDFARKSAKDSGDDVTRSLALTERSVKATEDSLTVAQAALQATQRTNETAEAGLVAARAALRLEQRAWVAVTWTNYIDLENFPGEIRVGLRNTGRTPARAVAVRKALAVGGDEVPDQPFDPKKSIREVRGTIGVDVEVVASIPTQDIAIFMPGVKSGATKLYALGHVEYTDVFGAHHYTNFCAWHVLETKAWRSCAKFNDSN